MEPFPPRPALLSAVAAAAAGGRKGSGMVVGAQEASALAITTTHFICTAVFYNPILSCSILYRSLLFWSVPEWPLFLLWSGNFNCSIDTLLLVTGQGAQGLCGHRLTAAVWLCHEAWSLFTGLWNFRPLLCLAFVYFSPRRPHGCTARSEWEILEGARGMKRGYPASLFQAKYLS